MASDLTLETDAPLDTDDPTDIEGTRIVTGELRGPEPTVAVKVELGGGRQTMTVRCVAGHTWEHPIDAKKRAGKVCPIHEKFFKQRYPEKYGPPARVEQGWEDTEENLVTEVGYARRWRAMWKRAVRTVAARQNSWSVDLVTVEKYIWHLRWAELHRLYAQDEPYVTSSSGAVREHPGWKLAEAEEKRAQAIATELGIEGPDRNFVGISGDKPPGKKKRSQAGASVLEQEAEEREDGIVDNMVGPDGKPL